MTKPEHPEQSFRDPDFLDSLEGRTLRILSEYLGPMARLDKAKVNSTILFLGSAKADPTNADSAFHRYYWEAEELAYLLAKWAIRSRRPRARTSSSARAPGRASWRRPTAGRPGPAARRSA